MRLVVGRGMRLTTIGLALGLLGAVAAVRALANQLPGISGHEPLVFAGAAILLASVALLACWLPARRATRVNPIEALRAE